MKTKRKKDSEKSRQRLASLYSCSAASALKHLQALRDEVEGVRQADDDECVHRMRVASRRLRSALPFVADCVSRKPYTRWRKQLRGVTRALGSARDTDVQVAGVQHCLETSTEPQERAGLERILLRLRQRRQGLQAAVLEALGHLEASQLTTEMEHTLTAVLPEAGATGDDTPAPAVYRHTQQAIHKRLKALEDYAPYVQRPECTDELHAMRIAAKRLRYTMQALDSLYGEALDEPIRTARRLQNLLGDVHDGDVWAHELPLFLEEERARTLEYFGSAEPFEALIPGILALQYNRQQHRTQRYQEFVAYWQQVQEHGTWEHLRQILRDPLSSATTAAAASATPAPSDAVSLPVTSAPQTHDLRAPSIDGLQAQDRAEEEHTFGNS